MRFTPALLLLAALACSDRAPAVSDSELTRDLALANAAASTATPQFQDTALRPAPGQTASAHPSTPAPTRKSAPRSEPAPRPTTVASQPTHEPKRDAAAPVENPAPTPAPAPRAKGFAAGTSFGLVTKSQVCTNNLPGDKFVATLTGPVTGDNGAYMAAGTTVVMEVASVTPGDTPENAQIALRVRSILIDDLPVSMEGDVAIASSLERQERPRDGGSDKKKVIGGAVAGAIIGQIMGKDTKSTVIGAAVGAAAGTAVANAGKKYDACLPAGAQLQVTTSAPMRLSA